METALRQGDTLLFCAPPVIAAQAAVGGKKESEGPLAAAFDELSRDNLFGQKNWEAAERALQLRAARFSHLAIECPGEETSNEWCEPVTDEQYDQL